MDSSYQPRPVEFYVSAWFYLFFGLLSLAIAGACVYALSQVLPAISHPELISVDYALVFATILAVIGITAFFFYGSFIQLRKVVVPLPEFRLDSHGITAFARSGRNEFVPWSDTGPTSIGWTYGRTPTRCLKLMLKGGKERNIPDEFSIALEDIQATIIEFQSAYGACAPKTLQGPDDQAAEKIGLSGWVIGIGEIIAYFS